MPSSRFQQVYLAGHFVDARGLIMQFQSIIFRFDTTNGATIGGQTADIQVGMSTTARLVDSLSPVFADNIGPDEATVFSGTVQWFSAYVPGANPQGWDLRIDLQQPFLYRPSLGHLLVDFTVNGSTINSQIDAWTRSSDTVSSVFGSSSSPSGTASTLGLVTYFEGTLVPEPPAAWLILLGAFVMVFLRQRKT